MGTMLRGPRMELLGLDIYELIYGIKPLSVIKMVRKSITMVLKF